MPLSRSRRLLRLAFAILALPLGCRPAPQAPAPQATPSTPDEVLASLDQRPAWTELPPIDLPRHPAEKYLKGWTIVLDPGHGGDAHLPNFKRGPTGVREAEINFRVAALLDRLLRDAGVNVILTRTGDDDVSLERRAEIANTATRSDGSVGADLFISLHHNGTRTPQTNYTSVWYHADADWCASSLDVARYLTHRIAKALRTDVGYTSPLMTDRQLYQSGFAVLRHTRVPAVLLESSFHTNPAEEQRLTDPQYNLREAYAIYEGLCEYAYGGRPTQAAPEVLERADSVGVSWVLSDGLPTDWWGADRRGPVRSTIQVLWNGQPQHHEYDPVSRRLTVRLPKSPGGPASFTEASLDIYHQNVFKHHNWPTRYRLTRGTDDVWAITPQGRWTMTDEAASTQPASQPVPTTQPR